MSSAYDPGGSAGNRSCPFSFVVTRRRPANQRRRGDANDGAGNDAALRILDGADEGARQPLRGSHTREHDTRGGTQQQQGPPDRVSDRLPQRDDVFTCSLLQETG